MKDKATECKENIDNCKEYNDKANECQTCEMNYHLGKNKKICFGNNVPSCYKYDNETCSECLKGYLLQDNIC